MLRQAANPKEQSTYPNAVMDGLDPSIHETAQAVALHVSHEARNGVGGRDKPGHDAFAMLRVKRRTPLDRARPRALFCII